LSVWRPLRHPGRYQWEKYLVKTIEWAAIRESTAIWAAI
jgi:hypothetical protein